MRERRIEFETTLELFMEVDRAFFDKGDPEAPFSLPRSVQALVVFCAFSVVMAVAGLAFRANQNNPNISLAAAAGVAVGAGIIAAVAYIASRTRRLRERAYLDYLKNVEAVPGFGLHGRATVVFSEDSIEYEDRWGSSRWSWSVATRLEAISNCRLIVFWRGHGIVVPNEAIGDAAEIAAFDAEITDRIALARSEPGPISEFLSEHDVPCLKCRYNLRGKGKMACPECGEEVTEEALARAWVRRYKERARRGVTAGLEGGDAGASSNVQP